MAQEISRAESYSQRRHQLTGVTLGLSLKPPGPTFHLKNGGDDTCVLSGIAMRIREIRDTHGALLIPSKSAAKDGWVQRAVLGGVGPSANYRM